MARMSLPSASPEPYFSHRQFAVSERIHCRDFIGSLTGNVLPWYPVTKDWHSNQEKEPQ